MALTRFGGGTTLFNGETSRTIAWPASVTSSMFALVAVSYYLDVEISAPSGFTQRGVATIDGGSGSASRLSVYTRDCDGTESGNITIGPTGGAIYGNATLTVFSGDSALTYASISSVSTDGASSSSDAVAASISGTSGQGLIIPFAISDPPGTTNSGPSGFTAGDEGVTSNNSLRVYFKTLSSTGSTGSATWDYTNSRNWGAYSILVDGAAAGGGSSNAPRAMHHYQNS